GRAGRDRFHPDGFPAPDPVRNDARERPRRLRTSDPHLIRSITSRAAIAGDAIALLIGLVAAAFWPGVSMYDTVTQYDEVLSNEFDDWHPPVMVRLWQLMHPFASGTAPMF